VTAQILNSNGHRFLVSCIFSDLDAVQFIEKYCILNYLTQSLQKNSKKKTALSFCGKKGIHSIPNVPRMCHKNFVRFYKY
jgi:hypothetical protein